MRELYLYSEKQIHNTIKEMFSSFDIHTVSEENIKKNKFVNQNIILFTNGSFLKDLGRYFFLDNNVVIFLKTNKNFNNINFFDTKFFNNHININKFIDEIATSFAGNLFSYRDIKIIGEKIINVKTENEIFLTSLEKDILILLIDKKQTEKNYLLESVLKIKKDTETKTIESHLTRIRNKLLKINSKLKILSKGESVFLI